MYNENETDSMLRDIAKLEDENYNLREELKFYKQKCDKLEEIVFNASDYVDLALRKLKESEKI